MDRNEKIKQSLIKYYSNNKQKKREYKLTCKHCHLEFIASNKYKMFCSVDHKKIYNSLNKPPKKQRTHYAGKIIIRDDEYKEYCRKAEFKLTAEDLAKIPNSHLLIQNGMFNTSTNKNGMVRDHMFSKRQGFLSKISEDVISHPANCMFLTNQENINKADKCSLNIDELYERIGNWDKYPVLNLSDYYRPFKRKRKSVLKGKTKAVLIKNGVTKEVDRNQVPQYKKYGWNLVSDGRE